MPRGLRIQCSILILIALATAIVFSAASGGSVWPPLIICVLVAGGAMTPAWWLGKVTGLSREMERLEHVRKTQREPERAEDR
jgi:hypothetical protein